MIPDSSLTYMQDEKESSIKIKKEKLQEQEQEQSRRRKVARPGAKSTVFEMDEDGGFRQGSALTMAAEPEVIGID